MQPRPTTRLVCVTAIFFTLTAQAHAQAPAAQSPAQSPTALPPPRSPAALPPAQSPAALSPPPDAPASAQAQPPSPPTLLLASPLPAPHPIAPLPASDAPTPQEPPRGVRMMAAGGATLVLSVPIVTLGLLKAGGTCLRAPCDDSATDLTGGTGLIVVGMLGALAGSALIGYGAMRHRQWRAWRDRHLAPRVARSAAGTWTAGFTLQF